MANTTPTHALGGYAFRTNGEGYYTMAVDTNGTTAVNVFGEKGAPADLEITGVFVAALDTTAGDITLAAGGSTVEVVAKGVTAGGMTAGTTLANTSVDFKNTVTVVSDSAGNARVYITFKVTT